MKADNPFDLTLPAATAKIAEDAGVYKATQHPLNTFNLAMTAGVFISTAFFFYITATTGTDGVPFGLAKLVGGMCFSLGLMLVVVSGADLFTSTVLTVIAKTSGFEHGIANMFMIPLAIVVKHFASPTFWPRIGATPEQLTRLTLNNFIINNLIPVTIGNIIGGGLLVELTY